MYLLWLAGSDCSHLEPQQDHNHNYIVVAPSSLCYRIVIANESWFPMLINILPCVRVDVVVVVTDGPMSLRCWIDEISCCLSMLIECCCIGIDNHHHYHLGPSVQSRWQIPRACVIKCQWKSSKAHVLGRWIECATKCCFTDGIQ